MNCKDNVPTMMFGSFQISDDDILYDIVSEATRNGIKGFDTSPSYRTEEGVSKAINRYIKEHPQLSRADFYIQSKVDAWQMIEKKGDIRPFVKLKLKKINQPYFDCLLIHWPQPDYFIETWKYMEEVYRLGMVRSIGLCNCQRRHLDLLKSKGFSLLPMIIQNEIHPFNTDIKNVEYFKSLGINIQAYSPLCRMIPQISNNEVLINLAKKYNVTIVQLILRWHLENGIVPVVKTSKKERIRENIFAMQFRLNSEDVEIISGLNKNFKIFLESRCCPGY